MKIPRNMNEKQVLDVISLVVNRIAPKYTFQGYEVDDIKQEAFLICMDALDRYDQKRPLENFLSVHLSNRLKNFIRDNYYVKDVDENKKKILRAGSISENPNIVELVSGLNNIELEEIKKIIDKKLDPSYRADYLKILNGIYVNKKRRDLIVNEVVFILKESGYA
jgi:RNA polymerase sigma factor (sigma-70 family)